VIITNPARPVRSLLHESALPEDDTDISGPVNGFGELGSTSSRSQPPPEALLQEENPALTKTR